MNIRNFVIIAHIDHGKSTLADRFLEITGTVEKRKMREQFLDRHPLERERGITIKMAPVRMIWRPPNHASNQLPVTSYSNSEQAFILNLIDTPGHVDFSYEVSRALAAVEGAILLVDATQGVQAQTLANLRLAQKENLVIIPAINKIDLTNAEVEKTEEELISLLDGQSEVSPPTVWRVSAKTGEGVERLLRAAVEKIPPPAVRSEVTPPNGLMRALIFDSIYDPYLGVVAHIRVFDGEVRKGERLKFLATGAEAEALEVGFFSPERTPAEGLGTGEIGYIATGIKEPEKVRVGDTVSTFKRLNSLNVEALPGYREPIPMVFASVFPEDQDDYEKLRDAMMKLKLEDSALSFEVEESKVFGRGFRAGFLGMLHTEIVSARLLNEHSLNLIFTAPSVAFRVKTKKGDVRVVRSAARMPEHHEIDSIEEPWVNAEIIAPPRFLGALTVLINERAGAVIDTTTLIGGRLSVSVEIPLREVMAGFYDALKSVSSGFASMAYKPAGYRPARLVRLDIAVAGERIPAFSEVIPRVNLERRARARLEKLKELLPRELFSVALQGMAEGRVIARETIPAAKKDVTGYLYGGDRTRKMKLWKKQKRGKKRLKETGRVQIPPEVFLKMFQ